MTGRRRDVVVVGGGPVGLAFAAAAGGRGLDVLVLEARPHPIDKACGEGLLPAGVRALEALGVRARLTSAEASPIRAIRWVDAAGPAVEVALPAPGGLGVRRSALSAALLERACAAGAEVRTAEVVGHRRGAEEVTVTTSAGEARARLLVAADGLGSPIRRREGLELPVRGPRRFGVRRHLSCAGGGRVEVHLGDRVEAYLTPVGPGRLGVAFLFEEPAPWGWDALLGRFPLLGYERAWRRRWAPYARSTRALLAVARRPALRRRLIAFSAWRPGPLARLVAATVG